MTSRILLTGASGFTGQHFMRLARSQGHQVVTLQADLGDGQSIQQELANQAITHVVHLAGISSVDHAHESDFYKVNTVGTTVLLKALLHVQPPLKSVLIASSANIYGNCEQSPIAERQPPAPVNHYASSKLAMEHMALAYADRLPIFITRPFNYTGPGQSPSFLIPKLVDHFARRAPVIELGNLHVEREFNDVRMVCEAYLRLLEQATAGQIYNLCTGLTYSLQQVLAMLQSLTGHTMEVRVNPAFVRTNEVHRLCGDPRKLIETIGPLPDRPLAECLSAMLKARG